MRLSKKLIVPMLAKRGDPPSPSCAVAVGRILLNWMLRPYSLRRLKGALSEALGASYPSPSHQAPCFAEDSAPSEMVALVQARLEALRWIPIGWVPQDFFCALVGQLVFVLERLRRGDASALVLTPETLRGELPRRWVRGQRRPVPGPVRAFGPSVPDVPPAVPSDLCVLGPDWWTGLLMEPRTTGRGLLVGLDLRMGLQLEDRLGALQAAKEQNRPTAAWLLAGAFVGELEAWAPFVDSWYVSDRSLLEAAAAVTGHQARWLAPAVQPLLQNPFGWWNPGDSRPRWGGEEQLPPTWHEVQARARGLVDLADGPPHLRSFSPPWNSAARRFRLARTTLLQDTLEGRLQEVCGHLGVEPAMPRRPWISVLTCTHRPDLCLSAIESFAKQSWPDRELVLLLHGPGFDVPAILARLQDLPFPTQLVQVPPAWALGDLMQLGFQLARGELVAPFEHDDWFGTRFLADMALLHRVSGAVITGKSTLPVRFEADSSLHLILPGREFTRGAPAGCNAMFRREVSEVVQWEPIGAGLDTAFYRACDQLGITMATADRFNYVYCRHDFNTTGNLKQAQFLKMTEALPLWSPSHPSDAEL